MKNKHARYPSYQPTLFIGLGGTGIRVLRHIKFQAEQGNDEGLRQAFNSGTIQLLGIDTDYKSNSQDDEVDAPERELVAPELRGEAQVSRLDFVINLNTNSIFESVDAIRAYIRSLEDCNATAPLTHPRVMRCLPMPGNVKLGISTKAYADLIKALKAAIASGEFDPAPKPDRKGANECANEQTSDSESTHNPYEDMLDIEAIDRLAVEALNRMTPGMAASQGARQTRLLGRIAGLLQSNRIKENIDNSFRRMPGIGDGRVPPRIVIIASLAGGTGSGLFWDVAMLARKIAPSAIINTAFVLAEPFTVIQEALRVRANVYAALLEISIMKNWRFGDLGDYIVEYPIGENGVTLSYKPEGRSLFDFVFIYSRFERPLSADRNEDVLREAVNRASIYVAQNVVVNSRLDIRVLMDVGINNETGDRSSAARSNIASSTFSTGGVRIFGVTRSDDFAAALLRLRQDELKADLTANEQAVVDQRVGDILTVLETGNPIEEPRGNRNVEDLALDQFIKSSTDTIVDKINSIADEETSVNRTVSIDVLEREIKFAMRVYANSAGAQADDKSPHALLRDYYGVDIINSITSALQSSFDSGVQTRAPGLIIPATSLLNTFAEEQVSVLTRSLRDLRDALDGSNQPSSLDSISPTTDGAQYYPTISKGTDRTLSVITKRLSELSKQVKREGNSVELTDRAREQLRVDLPIDLARVSVGFGLIKPTAKERSALNFTSRTRQYNKLVGSAIQALNELLESAFNRALGPAADVADKRSTIKSALYLELSRRRDDIDGLIREIREKSEENYRQRETAVRALDSSCRERVDRDYDRRSLETEDVQRMLQQMPSSIDEVLFPVKPNHQNRIYSQIHELMRESALEASATIEKDLAYQDRSYETVRDFVNTLKDEFERVTTQIQDGNFGGGPFVCDALIMAANSVLTSDTRYAPNVLIERAELIDEYVKNFWALTDGFLRFWVSRPAYSVERLGGREAVMRNIESTQSYAFRQGAREPSVHRESVAIIPPALGEYAASGSESRSVLERLLTDIVRQVTGLPPQIGATGSAVPVIYSEQRYRSLYEIANIDKYRDAYLQINQKERALFHFDWRTMKYMEQLEGWSEDYFYDGETSIYLAGHHGKRSAPSFIAAERQFEWIRRYHEKQCKEKAKDTAPDQETSVDGGGQAASEAGDASPETNDSRSASSVSPPTPSPEEPSSQSSNSSPTGPDEDAGPAEDTVDRGSTGDAPDVAPE